MADKPLSSLDKKTLSAEIDICDLFVTPAIKHAGGTREGPTPDDGSRFRRPRMGEGPLVLAGPRGPLGPAPRSYSGLGNGLAPLQAGGKASS